MTGIDNSNHWGHGEPLLSQNSVVLFFTFFTFQVSTVLTAVVIHCLLLFSALKASPVLLLERNLKVLVRQIMLIVIERYRKVEKSRYKVYRNLHQRKVQVSFYPLYSQYPPTSLHPIPTLHSFPVAFLLYFWVVIFLEIL